MGTRSAYKHDSVLKTRPSSNQGCKGTNYWWTMRYAVIQFQALFGHGDMKQCYGHLRTILGPQENAWRKNDAIDCIHGRKVSS